jgi:hypothetical protein
METAPYAGIITFFTFALSVIAAVLAIDMYALLRTGEFGRVWRILIIASVMFALAQAMRLANWLEWDVVRQFYLADIAQLAFALMLGYAFYAQRVVFSQRDKNRSKSLSIEDRAPARRASDFFGEEEAESPAPATDAPQEKETDDGEEIEWDGPSSAEPNAPSQS